MSLEWNRIEKRITGKGNSGLTMNAGSIEKKKNQHYYNFMKLALEKAFLSN